MYKINNPLTVKQFLDMLDRCDSEGLPIYVKTNKNIDLPIDNFEVMKTYAKYNHDDLCEFYVHNQDDYVWID